MSDELTPIWRMRLRVLAADVSGLKAEMQWVRYRLGVEPTHQTQTSQQSWPTPTGMPSRTHSPSWPARVLRWGLAKLTGEALSSAAGWIASKVLTWALYAILGLPALAWLARWLRLFGLG